MILYVCKECGRWQDVEFVKHLNAFADNLRRAFNGDPGEALPGYACPAGCGLMVQVQPTDRVFVRTDTVEALPLS